MLLIDLHTHLNLLPTPLPFLIEKLFKQNITLNQHVALAKKYKKKIILSPVIYNVPGIHYGISGVKHQLAKLTNEIKKSNGLIKIIKSKSDLESEFDVGLVLQLESCRWIKKDKTLHTLEQLYDFGIRGVIPIHFIDNWLGNSCNYPYVPTNSSNDDGLKEQLAKDFFKACKDLKLWIDLSHMSNNAIETTLKFSHHAICMTHTSIKDIQDTKRAISKEHIKKIASLNGFVGLCLADRFVSTTPKFVEMINYFNNLGIALNYGIGSDFGAPIKTDLGLENYQTLIKTITGSNLIQSQRDEFFHKGALNFLNSTLV